MRIIHTAAAAIATLCFTTLAAEAQPTLTPSTTTVTPGAAITLTVTGIPGQQFAVLGSSVGAGRAYGGVNLAVGSDMVILALGSIGGTGSVAVTFTPPFAGSTLDRYYVQAATSPSAAFIPIAVSASVVLRNNDVVGGAIPGQFIPAVEKGVRQVLTEGAIAGFTLQDIRVSVYDGKHHAVDSKEVAFVSAGRKAFVEAIKQAAPIVLEPIVRIVISCPSASIGDVSSDLATRRARINGQDTLQGGRSEIAALVPLGELQDYLSRLKALTGGEGTYTMDLSHYDPVPSRKQQELVSAFKPHEEAE